MKNTTGFLFDNYKETPTYKWFINEIYHFRFFSGSVNDDSSSKDLLWKAKSKELEEVLIRKLQEYLEGEPYKLDWRIAETIIENEINSMVKPLSE